MVVFFDAGGTLIRSRASVGEIYARRAADFGVVTAPARLDEGFRRAFAAAPPLAFPGVAAADLLPREQAWWREIVRQALGSALPADSEAYFQALYADFADPAAWEVFADVVPVLEKLRARGFRLGVISNFDARLLPIMEGLDLSRFFASMTFSSGAGFAKPDPRIFAHALALHGAAPADAVHVGDSAADDVEGARAAGIEAVLVRTNGVGLEDGLAAASLP